MGVMGIYRTDNAEFQITELSSDIRDMEDYEERMELLPNYATTPGEFIVD